MMISPRCGVAIAAVCALFTGVGTAAAAASRFDDGSFENPVAAPPFQTFPSGQSIGPWLVTSGTVDLVGPTTWLAAEGNQSVDLNGANTGAVAQTFTTVPGTKYTV